MGVLVCSLYAKPWETATESLHEPIKNCVFILTDAGNKRAFTRWEESCREDEEDKGGRIHNDKETRLWVANTQWHIQMLIIKLYT